MSFFSLVQLASEKKASDLHLTIDAPPMLRIDGQLEPLQKEILSAVDIEVMAKQILSEKQLTLLDETGDIDHAISVNGVGRVRINLFKSQGSYRIALRLLSNTIPTMQELGLPLSIQEIVTKPRGLILVTGPTGSGKSTTLAAMIDAINQSRKGHIVTLEDPIEYIYTNKKSIINQREVGLDAISFSFGLRSALRQDPDVILVGEMRDLDTIQTAVTAAETGHLVLSTLHTLGSAKTIDRIIDVFPPHQQDQIRIQLATVLEGVISQQLVPVEGVGGRRGVFEVMLGTPAIRNLIREGKTHQIATIIQTNSKIGMKSMDQALLELYQQGIISRKTLFERAIDPENLKRYM